MDEKVVLGERKCVWVREKEREKRKREREKEK